MHSAHLPLVDIQQCNLMTADLDLSPSSSRSLSWLPESNKMRLPRQQYFLIGFTTVALFICVTLTFNSWVGKVLDCGMRSNVHVNHPFVGYGFRKLLQDSGAQTEKMNLEGTEQRLPQCIIIGVRKCGTRALLEFLALHPNIKIADMEMHFFNKDENYENGYGWYKKYMPYSNANDITIEKTPRYFISESAPERIKKFNSSIKLIVIFRHPTTRVISDYTQVYKNKLERNKTFERFEDIVINRQTGKVNMEYKAIRISMYYYHLSKWLRYFQRHQIHVVNGDNLIVNPLAEIWKIESFLGLNNLITKENLYFNETRGFYCMDSGKNKQCLGARKGRKHPEIDPRVVKKLNHFYQPYNKKLFAMIGQEFKWN